MLSKICRSLIHLYWKYIPQDKRQVCLYKESCSRYVHRKFEEKGFLAGMKALIYRFKNCNKHYCYRYHKDNISVETKTGEQIKESEISDEVLRVGKIFKEEIN